MAKKQAASAYSLTKTEQKLMALVNMLNVEDILEFVDVLEEKTQNNRLKRGEY